MIVKTLQNCHSEAFMSAVALKSFIIIGTGLKTHFERESAYIGKHWEAFYQNNMYNKIPNKIDYGIYAVYCDYENGFSAGYTMIIGCKVSTLAQIPQGMVGVTIPEQMYNIYDAKGPMPQALIAAWQTIRNDKKISRNFEADFEYYCPEFLQKPTENPVEIYVGIKK